jgi:hypothetical protein
MSVQLGSRNGLLHSLAVTGLFLANRYDLGSFLLKLSDLALCLPIELTVNSLSSCFYAVQIRFALAFS